MVTTSVHKPGLALPERKGEVPVVCSKGEHQFIVGSEVNLTLTRTGEKLEVHATGTHGRVATGGAVKDQSGSLRIVELNQWQSDRVITTEEIEALLRAASESRNRRTTISSGSSSTSASTSTSTRWEEGTFPAEFRERFVKN